MKFGGAGGAPAHVPGNASVTLFDAVLDPAAFAARSVNVYVPAGTPEKLNVSVRPSGIDVVIEPVTSSTIDTGVPPLKVLRHDRPTVLPFTTAARSCGADGAIVCVSTNTVTSFDAPLRCVSDSANTRQYIVAS